MQVIKVFDVNELSDKYGQILHGKEAAGRFILYYAFSFSENMTSDEMTYGVVVKEADTQLLFSISKTHCLALYAVNKEYMAEAAQELVDDLLANNIFIHELRGSNDVCVCFMEHYKRQVDCSFAKLSGMDIMELHRLHDIKQAEGTQRLARSDEAQLIVDWIIESQLEAKTSETDYEAVLKMAARYIDEGRVYLFEKDEIAVSMVIKERTIANGVVLSYVFTPVEYRGEGYATANVYYLSKALLEEGFDFCTMLVDKRNPLSVRAYEKIGYVIVDDIYEYKVFPPDAL
jgi:hypothetical protein